MPRTSRVYHGHQEIASAIAACSSPGPNAATIAIAKSSDGNARNKSVMRMMRSSSRPPANPASAPNGAPMRMAMNTTPSDTNSAGRAAIITRLSMSRPNRSVPKGCSRDMGSMRVATLVLP